MRLIDADDVIATIEEKQKALCPIDGRRNSERSEIWRERGTKRNDGNYYNGDYLRNADRNNIYQ